MGELLFGIDLVLKILFLGPSPHALYRWSKEGVNEPFGLGQRCARELIFDASRHVVRSLVSDFHTLYTVPTAILQPTGRNHHAFLKGGSRSSPEHIGFARYARAGRRPHPLKLGK